jgi:DivIVA domain-containing protein
MTLLYVLLGALVVGAVAFGVAVLVTGADPGLATDEPEGSSVPLPGHRPLTENDFQALRFDTGLRGYRMSQVDSALRRAAYDVGYKTELVAVLEAEVAALRDGRQREADELRKARIAALGEQRPAQAVDEDVPDPGPDPEPGPEPEPGEQAPVSLAKEESEPVGDRS